MILKVSNFEDLFLSFVLLVFEAGLCLSKYHELITRKYSHLCDQKTKAFQLSFTILFILKEDLQKPYFHYSLALIAV